ncbi:GNAT family N-acetyltransferase [Microbispora amethystogenes]|uniref:N-acetyltransferase n=1 Tax=Microbispora amethystogenes TaxID=1427754 RepID=A0ABQ4FC22_9ACTN|nr:GNAT family N-acetyltransferase [Microbispora amethystogenes]GIH32319.1 N-acetyltransferase [Microbispora amethystogenes]
MDAERPVGVGPATPADTESVRRILSESWGGPYVAVHAELIDASAQRALLARVAGRPVGLLTYRAVSGTEWEIVTLDAVEAGRGVGRALLDGLRAEAAWEGVTRLWLVTTNENVRALRFYQRYGFDLVAVHRNAVEAARRLKPSIPTHDDGIAIRHELELELLL